MLDFVHFRSMETLFERCDDPTNNSVYHVLLSLTEPISLCPRLDVMCCSLMFPVYGKNQQSNIKESYSFYQPLLLILFEVSPSHLYMTQINTNADPGFLITSIKRGHGGRVVTLSPPTSEAGFRFPAWPQVGKLVVACRWSAVYSTEP